MDKLHVFAGSKRTERERERLSDNGAALSLSLEALSARTKVIPKLQYGVITIVICKYNVFGAHEMRSLRKSVLEISAIVHNIEF